MSSFTTCVVASLVWFWVARSSSFKALTASVATALAVLVVASIWDLTLSFKASFTASKASFLISSALSTDSLVWEVLEIASSATALFWLATFWEIAFSTSWAFFNVTSSIVGLCGLVAGSGSLPSEANLCRSSLNCCWSLAARADNSDKDNFEASTSSSLWVFIWVWAPWTETSFTSVVEASFWIKLPRRAVVAAFKTKSWIRLAVSFEILSA